MKNFISYDKNSNLPEISDMVMNMWKDEISISKASDALRFKDCTTLSLAWDKWIDDTRWISNPNQKNIFIFDITTNETGDKYNMLLEIDDHAVEVDKRAFHKAILLIAEKTLGKISMDGLTWMNSEEYAEIFKEHLKHSFTESVDLSLVNKTFGLE